MLILFLQDINEIDTIFKNLE